MIYRNRPAEMTENHDFQNVQPLLMYYKLETGEMFILLPEKHNYMFYRRYRDQQIIDDSERGRPF